MNSLYSLTRLSFQVQKNILLNYVPCRTIRAEEKIKWIRPTKVPSYHSSKSGDLSSFRLSSEDDIHFNFKSSIHLIENEGVQEIFKLRNQSTYTKFEAYRRELIDRVKGHQYDTTSKEVKIARCTAQIRIHQYLLSKKSSNTKLRCILNELIHRRRRHLKQLREADYKKFEWILEKLEIVFKPDPIIFEKVARKKSVRLLAELRNQKIKEAKLGKYKEELDNQKIPFLEKKLKLLKCIKEKESSLNMEPSVFDSDIEECVNKIEKVKLEIKEAQKYGYVRKVHPYTLVHYHPQKVFKNTSE